MAIVINGSGTVTGISVGGLPDDIVDAGTLADNAVGLAQMAGGTDGNIITYDTSGNPAVVATGSSGQVLTSAGADAVPTMATLSAGGITEADIWTMGTDFFDDADPIINWARSSFTNSGLLGTGMGYSAGVFSFPSTGFWRVQFKHGAYVDGDDRSFQIEISATANNSSYGRVSNAQTNILDAPSSNTHAQCVAEVILDITDISNDKVRFKTWSQNASTRHYGYTQSTTATFIRLGDT